MLARTVLLFYFSNQQSGRPDWSVVMLPDGTLAEKRPFSGEFNVNLR